MSKYHERPSYADRDLETRSRFEWRQNTRQPTQLAWFSPAEVSEMLDLPAPFRKPRRLRIVSQTEHAARRLARLLMIRETVTRT